MLNIACPCLSMPVTNFQHNGSVYGSCKPMGGGPAAVRYPASAGSNARSRSTTGYKTSPYRSRETMDGISRQIPSLSHPHRALTPLLRCTVHYGTLQYSTCFREGRSFNQDKRHNIARCLCGFSLVRLTFWLNILRLFVSVARIARTGSGREPFY